MPLLTILVLVAAMTTNTAHTRAAMSPENSNRSAEVQKLNSERDSLKSQTDLLDSRRDYWKKWYSGLAIAVIVSAGALGLLSWAAERLSSINEDKSKPLAIRISQIDQTISDLLKRESDERIATAQKDAGNANDLAGKANERAEELSRQNIELKGALAKEAQDSKAAAEELRKQNLETEVRLSAANETLEAERLKRLETEKALAPRELWVKGYADRSTNLDDLKRLAPVNVLIEYVRDVEAGRAAANLKFILETSGWKVDFGPSPDANDPDGVSVGHFITRRAEDAEKDWHGSDIAEVLVAWLKQNDWAARGGVKQPPPEYSLLITVGLKPNTFGIPEQFKDGAVKEMSDMDSERSKALAPHANPKETPISIFNMYNNAYNSTSKP